MRVLSEYAIVHYSTTIAANQRWVFSWLTPNYRLRPVFQPLSTHIHEQVLLTSLYCLLSPIGISSRNNPNL